MEGTAETGSGTQNQSGLSNIDITKWLADNKLQKIEEVFRQRDVGLDEIVEFTEQELNDFATDLQLDTLQKKRFVKAVQDLQPKNKQPSSNIDTYQPTSSFTTTLTTTSSFEASNKWQPSSSTSSSSPSSLSMMPVSSPQEQKTIQKLTLVQDKTYKLINELQNSFQTLDQSSTECQRVIEQAFDKLIKELVNKQKNLTNEVDLLQNTKTTQLSQQVQTLKQYSNVVNDGKIKYETYLADQTLDINRRKKMIFDMVNGVMFYPGVTLLLITQPKMILKDYKPTLSAFLKNIVVDDCDQPMAPLIYISKADGDTLAVEWTINDRDLQASAMKPILAVSVEWAILPKEKIPTADSKIFQNLKNQKVTINPIKFFNNHKENHPS